MIVANRPALTVQDILGELGQDVSVVGRLDRPIRVASALIEPGLEDAVTFCDIAGSPAESAIRQRQSGTVICDRSVSAEHIGMIANLTVIRVFDPRLAFIRLLSAYFSPRRSVGIHPTVDIAENVAIGNDVYIGPYVVVGRDCAIGDRSTIHAHVCLYGGCQIGCDVVIHAGAVIGADGFGYHRAKDGALTKFPQLGNVVIEDGVEIGANVCVDRGTLGATRIGRDTCVDDLAYVAHNTSVGANALVMASAVLCGSTMIGDRARVGPGATVREERVIGADAILGIGSLALESVASGTTAVGVPARLRQPRG